MKTKAKKRNGAGCNWIESDGCNQSMADCLYAAQIRRRLTNYRERTNNPSVPQFPSAVDIHLWCILLILPLLQLIPHADSMRHVEMAQRCRHKEETKKKKTKHTHTHTKKKQNKESKKFTNI